PSAADVAEKPFPGEPRELARPRSGGRVSRWYSRGEADPGDDEQEGSAQAPRFVEREPLKDAVEQGATRPACRARAGQISAGDSLRGRCPAPPRRARRAPPLAPDHRPCRSTSRSRPPRNLPLPGRRPALGCPN